MGDNPREDGVWTMDRLLVAEAAGERLKFLPFWGHTPPGDGSIGPHVLSQWFESAFDHEGVRYRTAEHFMMAGKARLFGDLDHLAAILDARTPAEAKALGRRVRGFSSDLWDQERVAIVRDGSVAKFGSSATLRDRIWGIGMGRNNPSAERPSEWRGRNLLGFALMQARACIASH